MLSRPWKRTLLLPALAAREIDPADFPSFPLAVIGLKVKPARAASLSAKEIVVPTGTLEMLASLVPTRHRLVEMLTPEIVGAVVSFTPPPPAGLLTLIVTVAGGALETPSLPV